MAGKPAVQVRGADEFRRAAKRMGASAADLTDVNRQAADIVAGDARANAPFLSGKLRGSVTAKARQTSGRVEAGRRLIPYAGVIHFGWPGHGIEPQPFLYDALDHRRDDVVRQYSERVTDLVKLLDRETPG